MKDEIMEEISNIKNESAKRMGGFENCLAYFQTKQEELEKQGFKFIDSIKEPV